MSHVLGAALVGVDGVAVEVEVRLSSQLPRVDIVGLPEAAVRESASRVRAAIAALGARFPDRRVTVNLAPAAIPKGGAGLDLAIAVGLLAAQGEIEPETVEGRAFFGELALDGRLRPVRGALALTLAAQAAGRREVVVPEACAAEAGLAEGIAVVGAPSLAAVVAHLRGVEPIEPISIAPALSDAIDAPCLRSVRGQSVAKRALEISAAGSHAILFSGPPGAGKSLMARCLPGILPPLTRREVIEATRIHGAAGRLPMSEGPEHVAIVQPPFRAPHHTASPAGLLGGGSPPRPGEVSLAHCGVLLLDEFPEFDRRCLEALRQILEERCVRLARARYRCTLPARFLLIAACNPCPCGWYRSGRDCACDDGALARYRRRLSGPLLDRIDLHIGVPAVPWKDLSADADGESSATVRNRVVEARALARERGFASNAEIPDEQLDKVVNPHPEALQLLGRAVDGLGMSARAARRVLKVARTIADLAGELRVSPSAIAEALESRGEFHSTR